MSRFPRLPINLPPEYAGLQPFMRQLWEELARIEATGATSAARVLAGTGTPEGAVAAAVGTLYLRSDGSTGTVLYVKESGTGNTGWVAK